MSNTQNASAQSDTRDTLFIPVLKTCERCGSHLVLMLSIKEPDHKEFLVLRCLRCFEHPVEEVIELAPSCDCTTPTHDSAV